MAKHKFHKGWLPDLPDHRDFHYSASYQTLKALPALVDLRPLMPPVYDQGDLGSCTANAIAGAVQYDRGVQKLTPDFVPSRLFIYYNERVIENSVESDAGAAIRDGIKTVVHQGVCPETEWPYDIRRFATQPTAQCYEDALQHRATVYARIMQNVMQMKGCLASGFPFVFGFAVFPSFESDIVAETGVVPLPRANEPMLGGHAVMAVGYIDRIQRFIVRNSWSSAWGANGYCYMPYRYLSDIQLAADFWTIKQES